MDSLTKILKLTHRDPVVVKSFKTNRISYIRVLKLAVKIHYKMVRIIIL